MDADGRLRFEPSLAVAGDLVEVRALMPVYLVVSACPQDLVPINGTLQRPSDIHIALES